MLTQNRCVMWVYLLVLRQFSESVANCPGVTTTTPPPPVEPTLADGAVNVCASPSEHTQ